MAVHAAQSETILVVTGIQQPKKKNSFNGVPTIGNSLDVDTCVVHLKMLLTLTTYPRMAFVATLVDISC